MKQQASGMHGKHTRGNEFKRVFNSEKLIKAVETGDVHKHQ